MAGAGRMRSAPFLVRPVGGFSHLGNQVGLDEVVQRAVQDRVRFVLWKLVRWSLTDL